MSLPSQVKTELIELFASRFANKEDDQVVARLRCSNCDAVGVIETAAELVAYIEDGWPTCCGEIWLEMNETRDVQ